MDCGLWIGWYLEEHVAELAREQVDDGRRQVELRVDAEHALHAGLVATERAQHHATNKHTKRQDIREALAYISESSVAQGRVRERGRDTYPPLTRLTRTYLGGDGGGWNW